MSLNLGPITFDDEFNTLNLQRQGAANGWATSYEWAQYNTLSAHTITGESEVYVDPTFAGSGSSALGLNPFSINNGVLSITADPTPDWAKGSLWNSSYTSGLLTTAGSFAQTYGYFEMKAELPAGQGAFPAFWLLSQDGSYNEIDIVEAVNGQDEVWNHIHYHPTPGSADRDSAQFHSTAANASGAYHTYGLLWTPETLTWYVDGNAIGSVATPAALNSPMYMLVDYAVGGSWAGAPSGQLSDMKIDYVRAYSLGDSPATATTTPAASTPAASAPAAGATSVSGGPSLSIAANQAATVEGNSGITYSVFTVTRTGDLSKASTAVFGVSGSGPHPADAADFSGGLMSGEVYFGEGETSKSIWVPIAGDTAAEYDEGFTLSLSGATGATLATAQASTLIANEDAQPVAVASGPTEPALDASAAATTPAAGSQALAGTSGNDVFTLSPKTSLHINGYDAVGADALKIPTGAGGFDLHALGAGQTSLKVMDAQASWNNIASAQVVRWAGQASVVDSAEKVDGLLQAMPGNHGGGVLVVGYAADDKHVAVYYDSDAAHAGGATLVASFDNLTAPSQLGVADWIVS